MSGILGGSCGAFGRLSACAIFCASAAWQAVADDYPVLMQRLSRSKLAEPAARPTREPARREQAEKPPVVLPFHIINYRLLPAVANFSASGFMGDVSDVRLSGAYEGTRTKGFPCLRVKYAARGDAGWAGVMWQNPANNWGSVDGGYNLSKATNLSFWARGAKGGEVVEFILGGASSLFPDSDGMTSSDLILNKEWTRYLLDLSEADLSYISSGFGFVIKQDENPAGCVFYLDEVQYQ